MLEVQRDASDTGARLYRNFGMQSGKADQGRGHFIMDISTSDAFTTAQELQRLGRSLLNLELQVLRLDWRLNRNKSCAKEAVRRSERIWEELKSVDCQDDINLGELRKAICSRIAPLQSVCDKLALCKKPADRAGVECGRRGWLICS